MDRTTICLGSGTRDLLREYKQSNGHPNYDAALTVLLEEAADGIDQSA